MLVVNNKQIPKYSLESENSLKERIASIAGSLPKYISILQDGDNITYTDYLRKIKKYGKSTDFSKIEDLYTKSGLKLDLNKDFIQVWLAFSSFDTQGLGGLGETYVIDSLEKSLVEKKYFRTIDVFKTFWRDQRDRVKGNIEKSILLNQKNVERNIKLYETFQAIPDEEDIGYTPFKTNKVSLLLYLDITDISILELFNEIVLNENVPFVACGTYYKLLKNFLPDEDWGNITSENIILKLNSKQDRTEKLKDYIDVSLIVEGEPGKEKIHISVNLSIEKNYISQSEFITRFLSVFPNLPISVVKTEETYVSGEFFFPQQRLNSYVFSDLVMNNGIFSKLINIDESVKATKKKSENSQAWLHIHFSHFDTGSISSSIIQRIVDRNDPEMRTEDPEIFEHNSPYIRVYAKAKNKKSIEYYQYILSKLLVLYERDYDSIVNIYKEFIPDFGKVEEYITEEKRKNLNSEIFTKNYSRSCSPERTPTVVPKEDAKEIEEEGKQQVIVFPRNIQEEEPNYPSDGKNQKYYICNNPEYPYPSVQVNKLANADIYPYLPCCFKTDQMNRENTPYQEYYLNKSTTKKEKRQVGLITTDKILLPNQFGQLPQDLKLLFDAIETDPEYTYIRVGTERTPDSFLYAVLLALDEQTKFVSLSTKKKADLINKTKQALINPKILPLSKQSCYDLDYKMIENKLSSYIDPRYFIQLLEGYFNCTIFLFNKEKMVLPRHIQGYYTNKKEGNCIFIYEHWGSESDHAKYPQCELIVRWHTKKSSDTQYLYKENQKISINITSIFNLLNETYSLYKQISPISFPHKFEILSQQIDSYGKTRCVEVEYKGNSVYVLTTPIPPLAVEEKNLTITPCPLEIAMELLKTNDAEIISQTVLGDVVKEINGIIGNVKVAIPVSSEILEEYLPIQNSSLNYIEKQTSVLSVYNRNKKLARYFVEYMFWLFSGYLVKNNIEEINDDILEKFGNEFIQVDETFVYKGEVKKNFSLKNPLMQKNKLIATSDDMKRRLLYTLKLYSIRDIKTLREYHERKSISHYYQEITDFVQHPGQVIVKGENSVEKWIQELKFSYTLCNKILIGQKLPYFFKNKNIEDTVFLAQNTTSLDKALDVSLGWLKKGTNMGDDSEEQKYRDYKFTLYSYKNSNEISVHHIDGKTPLSEIRIIGYKITGTPFYTALLEL